MTDLRQNAGTWVRQHLPVTPLRVAAVAYAVACIPTYVWLEGPVGATGQVPASTALVSLLLGSILAVPLLTYFVNQRFVRHRQDGTETGGQTDD